MNERIEKLRKFKEEQELKKLNEEKQKEETYLDYEKQIENLGPRIYELVTTAREALKCGIKLDNSIGTSYRYDSGYFISEGWAHLTGFTAEYKNGYVTKITGVGKIGGGASNYNLKISQMGDIIEASGTAILSAMEIFLLDSL